LYAELTQHRYGGTRLAIPHLARLPDSGTEFLHTLWGLYALLDIHYVKKSVAQKQLKKSIEKPETKDKKTTETCLERTQSISRQDQQGSWNKCETSAERIRKTPRKNKTHA
jgi:hypothetical protein